MDKQIFLGSSSTDFCFGKEEVISFNYINGIKENTIEVTFRRKSRVVSLSGNVTPDKVWKEIYGIQDGKLELLKRIEGKHIPQHVVHESIDFSEDAN